MGVSKVDSSKRRQEMRFTLPRDIYHGENALEALKTFKGKRAFVCVGGGSMKRFGFLDRVVQYLQETGMEVKFFEGIESDPSVDTVMKGSRTRYRTLRVRYSLRIKKQKSKASVKSCFSVFYF